MMCFAAANIQALRQTLWWQLCLSFAVLVKSAEMEVFSHLAVFRNMHLLCTDQRGCRAAPGGSIGKLQCGPVRGGDRGRAAGGASACALRRAGCGSGCSGGACRSLRGGGRRRRRTRQAGRRGFTSGGCGSGGGCAGPGCSTGAPKCQPGSSLAGVCATCLRPRRLPQ